MSTLLCENISIYSIFRADYFKVMLSITVNFWTIIFIALPFTG